MNKRFLMIFLAIGMLMMASIACEASASTANIPSVVLTADKENPTETTVFTSDQTFYAVVTLANAPDSTKVKAIWYSIDEAGEAKQFLDNEIVGGGSPVTFTAANSAGWPAGSYRVEILLNDKVDKTIDFTVE